MHWSINLNLDCAWGGPLWRFPNPCRPGPEIVTLFWQVTTQHIWSQLSPVPTHFCREHGVDLPPKSLP